MGGESRPFPVKQATCMFPLRDTIRARSIPLVTWSLIAVNTLVFLYTLRLGTRGSEALYQSYALIPARLSLTSPWTLATLLTSAFLHGSWFHLISNMWTLFIFGDNVEDRMGSGRYLVFYLTAGVVAGLVQVLFGAGSTVPTIGASGAIAGVLGAYLVLFPHSRVITFIPIFILPWLVEIPAVIYLGIWFLSQLSSGLLDLGAAGAFSGIAWWAHIGGFTFGLALGLALSRRRVHPHHVYYRDEYWPW
jgi:membrane associated rhomboid family serine protease